MTATTGAAGIARTPTGSGAAQLRALLRLWGFRRLYATRLVSACGDGMFQAALASYVLFNPENATTPAETASALAALLLPYSLIGPFVGVVLDRWSRERILVVCNVVKVALVLGVAGLVLAGSEGVAFLITAVAALGVNRLFLSALSAGLPRVVDEEQLVSANALSTTSGSIATIVGAGIGGLFRWLLGSGDAAASTIVLIAAAVYAASSLVAATMPRDLLGPQADERAAATATSILAAATGVARDLGRAATHMLRRRRAADVLMAISAHRFFYGVATLTIVLLERNYFSSNVDSGLLGLGAVVGASGAGILVAALITPEATRRFGKRAWITWLLVAAAIAIAVFGLPFQRALLVAGAFVLGVCAQGIKICVDTTIQEEVDDVFRGRVFAVYDMLFNVTYVAAAAVTASALPASGKSTAVMTALVVGYLVAAGVFSAVSARHHEIRSDGGAGSASDVVIAANEAARPDEADGVRATATVDARNSSSRGAAQP